MSGEPIAFDYKSIEDTSRRKEVTAHTKRIYAHMQRSSLAVVDIGRRLTVVHELLGKSVFWAWVRGEFKWSASTASEYMAAFRRFSELDCLKMFDPTALYRLARKKTPEPAVNDAIELARAGERVTAKKAKQIIDRHLVTEASSNTAAEIIEADSASDEAECSDAATTRAPAAVVRVRTASDIRESLKRLRDSLQELTTKLSAKDRQSLADDLIELAKHLRSVDESDAPVKTQRRRRTTPKKTAQPRRKKTRSRELASAKG